jgi:GTP-binding protein Era
VGKSTLLNRLTGEKLAIVSPKPQTTRGRILGVVTKPEGQVALVDTPGIHEAKGALNAHMVKVARDALSEVDLSVFIVEAEPKATPDISPGNLKVLEQLRAANRPVLLVINKVDAVPKAMLLPLVDKYQRAFSFAEVLMVSARTGDGVDALLTALFRCLPEGEPMFDEEMLTDQQERALVAEFVREQVLHHCHQEVPYSTAVEVEVFDESEREPKPGVPRRGGKAGLIRIAAAIYLERESQKAIVIGKRGQMLKTIGTDARAQIERLLGTHVFLSLRVKVEPNWTESAKSLRKLGYV